MRQKWMAVGVSFVVAVSVVGSATHAAPSRGPCRLVVSACLDAGFVQGGARYGNGLWKDCVTPIMQGWGQRGGQLPRLAPNIVAACQASHPTFGQPNWAGSPYGTPRYARRSGPAEVDPEAGAIPAEPTAPPTATQETAPQASADAPLTTSSIPDDKSANTQSPEPDAVSKPAKHAPEVSSVTPSPSTSQAYSSPTEPPSAAASAKPMQTAELEPTIITPDTKNFGIEIGVVDKETSVRTLWRQMLAKHGALVTGLQARRMLTPDKKWQLIVGPFASTAEATKVCSLFAKENLTCEATAFAGDKI